MGFRWDQKGEATQLLGVGFLPLQALVLLALHMAPDLDDAVSGVLRSPSEEQARLPCSIPPSLQGLFCPVVYIWEIYVPT